MLHVIINDNLSDPYGEGLFEPNARRTISAHSSKKIPGSVNSGPLTQSTHFLKNLSNSCILESFSSFYSSRWHYPLIWIPVACYQQNLFKAKRARQVNG